MRKTGNRKGEGKGGRWGRRITRIHKARGSWEKRVRKRPKKEEVTRESSEVNSV